ncbi:hypothetical protein Pfo_008351 [Paulownia fortunei]|nr:hypothetical protein Pfo_008351 [Paulownia fortunei]
MENDGAGVVEGLPSPLTVKVHVRMCSELLNLVVRVSKVIPEIEAARPRASGIEALCLLNNGIAKAKSLLQHCSESSILYLALYGDAILSRCNQSRNLLERCLSQIQNMVPVMLAVKISGIILALRSAAFCLDPLEEEAGKVLRELLHRYGSTIDFTEEYALSAVHAVSLVIEKRSIRKLLDKFGESERKQKDNGSSEHEDPLPFASPYNISGEVELHVNCRSDEAQTNMLSRPVTPEEFVCPLSSMLMHDPVVIASGQTYERTWIQKWFDEGHDTCPKTNIKLAHLSFTADADMKDPILKWCAVHSFSTPDAKIQEALVNLGSSKNDLNLPLDFSNLSLRSNQGSDPSSAKIFNNVNSSHEIQSEIYALPWDSSCNVVEDVKILLKISDESWSMMPFGDFIRLLLRFLKDAHDLHDVEAQITGCLCLLELVPKYRNSISYMKEDAYGLLASFRDTEVAKQALSILVVLSFHQHCGCNIESSGALVGILKILDSQLQELLEPALIILSKLSTSGDIGSFIVPSEFMPKLIPLFENSTLARYDSRVSVAKTDDCFPSIAKLLENGSHVEQEHTVSILLSLCSQRVQLCQLIMDYAVIPGLVDVPINWNKKAKAMGMELMLIVKDELNATGESSVSNVITDSTKQRNDNS